MTTSARIHILGQVSELARRNGLLASDADAEIVFEYGDNKSGYQTLRFENEPCDPDTLEKFNKVMTLLGCDEDGVLKTANLREMEQAVEKAIALSPRPRTR